jgi:hypothetical protein
MFALAQTLARVPRTEMGSNGGTRTALAALREALDALLDGA